MTPRVVEVVGSSRILENLTTLYTEKVPLENIKESGTMTVNIALQLASLKTVPGVKDKVVIEYIVKERTR